MVIFEGKYLNYQWTHNEVPGTYYGMSGKGWMDQELFRYWLKDHFLKYAVPSRPLLLLMDGHSLHYEPSSVELAKENDSSCSVYHHIQLRILSLLIALSLVLSSVTG